MQKSVTILGIGSILAGILVAYLIFSLWPETIKVENNIPIWNQSSQLFWGDFTLSDDKRIILLVILSGFLGSYIHVTSSFTNYIGDKKFETSWTWWYLLRPFIGMSLGLIFYFVFRGGLFSGNLPAANLNIYGIMTLSALSGLFSDRATLKLEEIFESLFKPSDNREGKLKSNNPKSN